MNANEFADSLRTTAPRREAILAAGYSEEVADILVGQRSPQLRESPGDLGQGPLLDFLALFKSEHVEIGMLQLLDAPRRSGVYSIVGIVEADDLAIDESTAEIVVLDHATSGRILTYCAKDQSAFLDALGICAAALSKLASTSDEDASATQIAAAASDAANAAGGSKYADFYEVLLGVGA